MLEALGVNRTCLLALDPENRNAALSARNLADVDTVRLQQLNVAVAELDHQSLWQRAELGIVTIGGREELVRQALTAALDSIERLEPGRVLRSDIELIA